MSDARKYSEAEVREIIERAVDSDTGTTDGTSHADLLSIGEQIGVTPEVMTRAAQELAQSKLDAAARGAIQSRRRKWLGAHTAMFFALNALLFGVNFLTTPGEWWFLFSVFFWGLALAAHAALALGLTVSPAALARERRKLPAAKLRIDTSAPAVSALAAAEVLDSPASTEARKQTR